jgi:molecular chaperone GrpE
MNENKSNETSIEEAIETVINDSADAHIEDVEVQATAETNEEVEVAEELKEETPEVLNMVEELAFKLAAAEDEVKEQKDLVIRAKAHAQNEIRKAKLDADSKVNRTLKRFTEELLPVADSLEMAITHIDKENEALKAMAEGVEMTLKTMVTAFSKVGIIQINPLGEQANPEKHQIVSQQPIEGKATNEVVVVMQKGYEFNGKLIRPAMVMVAQ